MLVKAPAFTALVVVILGLGIGVNTAIFSIVYAVALKPLPFAEPSRLVSIRGGRSTAADPQLAYPDFVDLREQATTVEGMAGYATGPTTLTGSGDADLLDASFVTPDLFPVLGVKPLAGREFTANDNVKGAAPVAILSEALWRRRFAADPAVVGRADHARQHGFHDRRGDAGGVRISVSGGSHRDLAADGRGAVRREPDGWPRRLVHERGQPPPPRRHGRAAPRRAVGDRRTSCARVSNEQRRANDSGDAVAR